MFGDRGGQRRDDGPAFPMLAQFQGDGAADHRFLPFQRHGQPAHPCLPLAHGQPVHVLDAGGQIAGEAFIGPQEEMQPALDAEPALLMDIAHRRAGGQAQGHGFAGIADMAGSPDHAGHRLAPVAGRAQAHADARASRDHADDAGKGRGTIGTVVAVETGAEIDDLDHIAIAIALPGDEDRCVAAIGLGDFHRILHLHRPEPIRRIIPAQQRRKQRVAIHTRHTGPHHPPAAIDQRAGLAIADGPEIDAAHAFTSSSSHAWTDATVGS
jgi:hypothetical protein